MEDKLVRVASANGAVEGEILRAMLEAEGIESALSHEAAGTAFGLSVGPMGIVDVLVLERNEAEARRLIEAYRRGEVTPPGDSVPPTS